MQTIVLLVLLTILVLVVLTYFKQRCIMATVEEILASVSELTSTIQELDVKLDEVRSFIETLVSAANGATAEQLATILAGVDAAKASAATVLKEADALDLPA